MNYSPFKQPFRAPFAAPSHIAPMVAAPQNAPQVHTPEEDLPRALQYAADTSGCGFWRMIWPEHCLQKQSSEAHCNSQ